MRQWKKSFRNLLSKKMKLNSAARYQSVPNYLRPTTFGESMWKNATRIGMAISAKIYSWSMPMSSIQRTSPHQDPMLPATAISHTHPVTWPPEHLVGSILQTCHLVSGQGMDQCLADLLSQGYRHPQQDLPDS
ncbi:hypothetical protein EMPG_17087 [Blastomyces silverae]|uniref:Uncharacterized protein n=1 Tax=Blastomyces silverae TaxID=2060906 RepID=A0A0H1B7S2_9EURO|nr:hypothetical protein EMPG_17087 [Blastomyces silverae]